MSPITHPDPPNLTPITIEADPAYAALVAPDPLRRAAAETLATVGGKVRARHAVPLLTVVITGDDQIRELNRRFLGEDAPTDVLSFPSEPAPDATAGGVDFVTAPEAEAYLGDVVISYPRAREQAEAAGHSVEAELQLLVVHGVLHLLGYDDTEPAQRERMWAMQTEVLKRVSSDLSPFSPPLLEEGGGEQ